MNLNFTVSIPGSTSADRLEAFAADATLYLRDLTDEHEEYDGFTVQAPSFVSNEPPLP